MKKIILLLLVLSLFSCSFNSSDDTQSSKSTSKSSQDSKDSKSDTSNENGKDKEDDEEVIINVEATTIKTGDAIAIFRTTTILAADLESAVTTKASGIVLQINHEVGDRVKEGEVLAILESDTQQLGYASAKANYQKVLHNYERAKKILAKGLTNTEAVENLKFETRALQTRLSQAKLDLDFTKIRAPIAGTITKRSIKKGNLVQLHTQVYEIVNFDSLQAVINVPENKWSLFKPGLEVNFIFSNFTEVIKGAILRIDPIVDSATGTFNVVINIDKSQELAKNLRPGLFGKTEIILDKHENTLLVSKNAVIREDQTAYVYEVNADNTVTKRNVTIGYEMDDELEILAGIESNKRVVTTGKNNVSEESIVAVIDYND
ncbi:MAG: efflux RND transporter periplasmic adaptor subunit [Proteobacteria bacterium]|nr:efflux RND transporter periplasmic adaptor subunit [Pseudomonadota bacterium]